MFARMGWGRISVIAGAAALAWAVLVPRRVPLVVLSEDEELEATPLAPPPEAVLRGRPRPPQRIVDDLVDTADPGAGPQVSVPDAALLELEQQAKARDERLLAAPQRLGGPPVDAARLEAPKPKDPEWPIFTDDELGQRQAMRRGWRDYQRALRLHGEAALWILDRARRDMSEGLLLPEMADPFLRAPLEEAIAIANARIYGSKTPMGGVTEVIRVDRGDYPRHVVDRRPFGPNAVLYWTLGGRLDPRRLPAGDPVTVPLEPLWLFVDRSWHVLFVFLGDAFVKEFPVAVGKASTPTPAGTFVVSTMLDLAAMRGPNPTERWRPRLGSAWIRVRPLIHGSVRGWGEGGTSIHGTDEPRSIGTDASDGSIRMRDGDALEVLNWVNTHHGPERRVVIR